MLRFFSFSTLNAWHAAHVGEYYALVSIIR